LIEEVHMADTDVAYVRTLQLRLSRKGDGWARGALVISDAALAARTLPCRSPAGGEAMPEPIQGWVELCARGNILERQLAGELDPAAWAQALA
jgi:hypothetical protein